MQRWGCTFAATLAKAPFEHLLVLLGAFQADKSQSILKPAILVPILYQANKDLAIDFSFAWAHLELLLGLALILIIKANQQINLL